MKYYSEILDKMFDTDTALKLAEEEKVKQDQEAQAKKLATSRDKKAMADAIEKADEELTAAYKRLGDVKKEVANIYKKAEEQADRILKPALEATEKAEEKKYKAIEDFNRKYGVYSTTLTGNKAKEQFERAINFFSPFFW